MQITALRRRTTGFNLIPAEASRGKAKTLFPPKKRPSVPFFVLSECNNEFG